MRGSYQAPPPTTYINNATAAPIPKQNGTVRHDDALYGSPISSLLNRVAKNIASVPNTFLEGPLRPVVAGRSTSGREGMLDTPDTPDTPRQGRSGRQEGPERPGNVSHVRAASGASSAAQDAEGAAQDAEGDAWADVGDWNPLEPPSPVQRTCAECSQPFAVAGSAQAARKTCGPECGRTGSLSGAPGDLAGDRRGSHLLNTRPLVRAYQVQRGSSGWAASRP